MIVVVLLLGVLFLREPRFQRSEEIFLRWLLRHSQPAAKGVPLTVIDIGKESPPPPLEVALLLQALFEFKTRVVAVEPVLQWGDQIKDQEQIFLDQAMKIPNLLLGAELAATSDPDAPATEIASFTHVTGRRGDLPAFSAIEQQPGEDVRILSTLGFTNFPDEQNDGLHIPLLFQYRGEVIPAFALQAVMLWLRATPEEVKVDIGSAIDFPQGIKIPIRSDGTLLVNPRMAQLARHITTNELLLAAQQHESGATTTIRLEDLRDQLVLARTETNAPDLVGAAIATIQSQRFVRRVSWVFDCLMVVLAAALSGAFRRFSRVDLIIGAVAFSAAYCLIALAVVSKFAIWLPAWLPLGAMWISILFAIALPKPKQATRTVTIAAPPPAP